MDLRRSRSAREFGEAATPDACHVFRCGKWLVGMMMLALTNSCAVHYSNPRTGAEHLWGLGQLRLEQESPVTNVNWTAVTSGCRVPGLCLSVGRDHFGFTLGYLDHQRLAVVCTNQIPELQLPTNSIAWLSARDVNSRWAFGHLRMRGVGSPHRPWALVTGKALAGLGAGMGGGDTSLGVVLDSRQLAMIQHGNVHLKFDQDAPRWPGFDLFATQVQASSANHSKPNQKEGEP